MPSQASMAVVILIIAIFAVAILVPIIYKIMTGESARNSCELVASQIKISLNLILVKYQISPLVPLCSILVQI